MRKTRLWRWNSLRHTGQIREPFPLLQIDTNILWWLPEKWGRWQAYRTHKKKTNRSLYLCAVSWLLDPRIIFTAYVQNVIKWVKDIEGLLRKAKRISSHFHIPLNFIHLITLGETKSKHFKFSHKCQLLNFNKQPLNSTNIIFLHTNAYFL